MIFAPIKHSKLETVEDIRSFSCMTNKFSKTRTYYNTKERIIWVDYDQIVRVTPYRPEIIERFENTLFTRDPALLNFQSECDNFTRYSWLKQIAEEENWNYTYEIAHIIAGQKGLKGISLPERIQIREISPSSYFYDGNDTSLYFSPMVKMFVSEGSGTNIGTFIIINNKTLLMCDNYGRTFLIKVKDCINDVVNSLLMSHYTRNSTPENFVSTSKPENEFTL